MLYFTRDHPSSAKTLAYLCSNTPCSRGDWLWRVSLHSPQEPKRRLKLTVLDLRGSISELSGILSLTEYERDKLFLCTY